MGESHGVVWKEPLLEDANKKLGFSRGVEGSVGTCQVTTCEYGLLATDIMRDMGRNAGLNTQVTFWNSGNFKSGLPWGRVTAGDILNMHKYGNRIAFCSLQGSVLVKAIEYMLSKHGDDHATPFPGWLVFDGLRFAATYGSSGWTLNLVQVREGESEAFTDLDEDQMYQVGTNEWLLHGGDGYDFGVNDYTASGTLREAVAEHVVKNSPVQPPYKWMLTDVCLSSTCPWIESPPTRGGRSWGKWTLNFGHLGHRMYQLLPESLREQSFDSPAALGPMLALILLVVMGSVVLFRKFSTRYGRVNVNYLDMQVLE